MEGLGYESVKGQHFPNIRRSFLVKCIDFTCRWLFTRWKSCKGRISEPMSITIFSSRFLVLQPLSDYGWRWEVGIHSRHTDFKCSILMIFSLSPLMAWYRWIPKSTHESLPNQLLLPTGHLPRLLFSTGLLLSHVWMTLNRKTNELHDLLPTE